jgi:hypothetical protein
MITERVEAQTANGHSAMVQDEPVLTLSEDAESLHAL